MSNFENFLLTISQNDYYGFSRSINNNFINKIYKHNEMKYGIIKAENVIKSGHKKLRPIHLACDRGNIQILGTLMSSESDINVYSKIGNGPLHIAASRGHLDVVALLLREGCLTDTVNEFNQTPLHFAAQSGHIKVTKILLFNSSDPNITDLTNSTPLDLALSHGNDTLATVISEWQKLKMTLEQMQGGRFKLMTRHPDFKKFYINNDICIEAMLSYMKEVDRYKSLDNVINELRFYHYIRQHQNDDWLTRADVEAMNQIIDQDNALIYCLNHSDCCPYFFNHLMTLILDMDKMEENLQRIYKVVTRHANKNLIRMISKRKDFIRIKRKASWNRLHLAVSDDRSDMIEYILLKQLVNINAPDEMGNTPIFLACIYGRLECANILVCYGADLNIRNKYGQSLLQISIENGMEDFVKPILHKFKYVETLDSLGHSALHVSIKSGTDDLLEKLIPKYRNLDSEISDCVALTHQSHGSNQDLLFTISSKENMASLCLKVRGYINHSLISRMSSQSLQILDENNNSLLHLAAWNLSYETCQRLIEKGADINAVNIHGDTPLHEAVNKYLFDNSGHEELLYSTVRILIQAGASINQSNIQRQTPLQLALQAINERLIIELTNNSTFIVLECVDLEYLLSGKYNSLMVNLISKVPKNDLSDLLKEGFIKRCLQELDISSTQVLLKLASSDVRRAIFKDLLSFQEFYKDRIPLLHCLTVYDPGLTGIIGGETILTYLIKNEDLGIWEEMLQSQFEPSYVEGVNLENQTCLHVAAEKGNLKIIELILRYSKLCDEKDDCGNTALGLLLRNSSSKEDAETSCLVIKLAKILIRQGAELFVTNDDGEFIIDMCQDEVMKTKLTKFQKHFISEGKSDIVPYNGYNVQ